MTETQSPIMDLTKEKKPSRFVIQEHQRGKSSHLDIRFEVNDHLIGFTMDDPGRVGAPLRFTNDAKLSSTHKVLSQTKGRQPKNWLKTSGIVKAGEVGATKFLPARFKIIDSGTYEMGAQKPHFLEVFLNGKTYDGRFVFRKLPSSNKSEKVGKETLVWFAWKPIDQTPYALSNRAIQTKWSPPKGRSAMPKSWEGKIPSELQWWEKNWTDQQALETISEARKSLLKRNILNLAQLDFVLQRFWWKGHEHWELKFSNGLKFILDSNPIINKEGISTVKKVFTNIKKGMKFEGAIPPGEKGNPNKEITTNVEILDKGKTNLIERSDSFISFKIHGTKLKGFWIIKSHNGTWTLEPSQAAAKPKKLQDITLSEWQIGSIYNLSKTSELSLSQIAEKTGCSKSSIILWQKKLNLR